MSVTDTNFETRQEAQRRAAEEAGIVWPKTILPPGTALYESGVETLKNDRAAWRRLPLASEVVGLIESAIEAEDRRDAVVNVGRLRLDDHGRLFGLDTMKMLPAHSDDDEGEVDVVSYDDAMGYDDHAFRQLLAQVDPFDTAPKGTSSALLWLNGRERSEIVNNRIIMTDPGTQVTLRTKLPHEGDARITRAVLSKRYGSVTDQDIAKVLGILLKEWGDTNGRLDYKPGDERSRFEVIWPSEVPIETFKVGDIHYVVLSIGNSDTGEGGLVVGGGLMRAACANLTLRKGEGMAVSIRHVGDRQKLIRRLAAAIRLQLDTMQPLIDEITMAAKIPVREVWTPAKAIGALAKKYEIPKLAAEPAVKLLEAGRYPSTVWGMAAALQEAAHAAADWRQEADIEAAASRFQAKAVEISRGGPVIDIIARVLEVDKVERTEASVTA